MVCSFRFDDICKKVRDDSACYQEITSLISVLSRHFSDVFFNTIRGFSNGQKTNL